MDRNSQIRRFASETTYSEIYPEHPFEQLYILRLTGNIELICPVFISNVNETLGENCYLYARLLQKPAAHRSKAVSALY
jgi:hypothetical protein